MRIVIVTPIFWPAAVYGGPAHTVKSLVQALAARGEEVTVITSNCGGAGKIDVPVGQPIQQGLVKVIYLDQRRNPPLGAPPELEQWLEREAAQADVLHVMSTFTMMTWRACRWALSRRVPYVITTRGHLLPWNRWKDFKKKVAVRLLMNRLLQGAACLHATSQSEAEGLRSFGFSKVGVVPYGVEVPEELPDRQAARQHWGIGEAEEVLLYLGRLHPQKGVELLIRSVSDLVRQGRRPVLLLAGGGDSAYRQQLETLVVEQDIAQQCRFLGVVSGQDKWAFLRAGDLLVHLSSFESFGLAIGEALGVGVPVLIGERCGWEMVEEMNVGRRVPRMVEEVVAALTDLLADKAQLKTMSERASEWIQQEYDWNARVGRMIDFYRYALSTE